MTCTTCGGEKSRLYANANTEKLKNRGCNDRVKRLRRQFFKNIPTFTTERAALITKIFKETEGQPWILRRAKFFAEYCATKPIVIQPDELIIGNNSPMNRGVNGYPETNYEWEHDLDTFETREIDPLRTTDEVIKEYREEILPYWHGRSLRAHCQGHMPDWVKDLATGSDLIDAEIKQSYGWGHTHPGYGTIWVRDGFKGIKERALAQMEKIDYEKPGDMKHMELLEAAVICCDAMKVFGERHAAECRRLAESESDDKRKAELLKMAEVCDRVPWEKPRNFHEALQGIFFCQVGSIMEQSGAACGVGRLDQYLYPFYKQDIASGAETDESVLEKIECFFIKEGENIQLNDNGTAEFFGGYTYFMALNIGGVTPDGKDAVNELTYMMLDAENDIRLQNPNLVARMNRKNPDKYYEAVAKMVREGTGFPQVHNDDVGIAQMLLCGTTLEEARDYEVEGCTETLINGKMWKYSDAGQVNMPAAIELVLNRGYCTYAQNAGKKRGVDTGALEDLKTYEDFEKAVFAQLHHLIYVLLIANRYAQRGHEEAQGYPFTNCLFEGPFEKGREYAAGGAKYATGFSPSCVGLADIANSLAAVKMMVYDEKKMTLEEMAELCRTDFEGKEDVRLMLVNKVPKYGNDDPYVDQLAKHVADFLVEDIESHYDIYGNKCQSSMYPVAANTPLGKAIGALPSGRKAGVPLADGISPSQGTDKSPTEVIKSVTTYDHTKHLNGNLLNMKFSPSTLEGDLGIQRWISLLKTFFDMGGWHLQCNVISDATLRDAQEHPDEYPDLMVRVAGYSAYWNALCTETQNEIISRHAHNF